MLFEVLFSSPAGRNEFHHALWVDSLLTSIYEHVTAGTVAETFMALENMGTSVLVSEKQVIWHSIRDLVEGREA